MENVPIAEIMMRIQITANQNLRLLGLIGETLIFHCCENAQPRVSLVGKSTNTGWEVQKS